MRLLVLAALLAAALPAGAATVPLPGPACAGWQLERRGADMVLTCPRYPQWPWVGRQDWVTVRGWYRLCAAHRVSRAPAGDTIACVWPARW